jgi:hypothetical protein
MMNSISAPRKRIGRGRLGAAVLLAAALAVGSVAAGLPAQAAGLRQSPSVADLLQSNEQLNADERLVSANGVDSFVMQGDGNAVVYDGNNSPLWFTRTSTAGSRMVMQGDGNLVLYSPSNVALWNSATSGHDGAYAIMQGDGNLVIYWNGIALWNSFDASRPVVVAPVTSDTLTSEQSLLANQRITSANGRTFAVLQGDGNLVVYGAAGALWNSHTTTGRRLVMQGDGNLVLYNSDNKPAWFSQSSGNSGAHLTIQDDGNLVVYRSSGSAAWFSFGDIYYPNCDAVRAAGRAPLYAGQPGYRLGLDGDSNGVACE